MSASMSKPIDLIDRIKEETQGDDNRSATQIARDMDLPPAQITRAVRRRLRRFGLSGTNGIRKEVAVLETKLWRARQRLTQSDAGQSRGESELVREVLRLQDDLGELRLLARLGRIAGEATPNYSLPFMESSV
jgi:hypothetical protein